MSEEKRKEALWTASERSRTGPTHLCHDVGVGDWWTAPDPRHSHSHKCRCGIGRDHREDDFWEWEANWEPDEQWKGLWK